MPKIWAVTAIDKAFHRRPVLRAGEHERRVDNNIVHMYPGTSCIDKDPRDEWQFGTERPRIAAPWEPKVSGLICPDDGLEERQAEVASFRGYTLNEFEKDIFIGTLMKRSHSKRHRERHKVSVVEIDLEVVCVEALKPLRPKRVTPVTGCKSFLNVRYQGIHPCAGGPLFELTPFR